MTFPVNVHPQGIRKAKQMPIFPNRMGKVVNLDLTDAGRAVFKLANSMGPGSPADFVLGMRTLFRSIDLTDLSTSHSGSWLRSRSWNARMMRTGGGPWPSDRLLWTKFSTVSRGR